MSNREGYVQKKSASLSDRFCLTEPLRLMVAVFFSLSTQPAPEPGEHTIGVLKAAGYSNDELVAFDASGVVGHVPIPVCTNDSHAVFLARGSSRCAGALLGSHVIYGVHIDDNV
jgi:hypothetical protein